MAGLGMRDLSSMGFIQFLQLLENKKKHTF